MDVVLYIRSSPACIQPGLAANRKASFARAFPGDQGRVALGITPQGSHRSVLAQLRHTARQVRDSLRTVIATRSAKVKALAAGTR